MLILSLAVYAVTLPAICQPVADPFPRDALVRGLSSWERSIQAIETTETMWQPAPVQATWTPALKSRRGFVDTRTWYIKVDESLGHKNDANTGVYIARGNDMLTASDEPTLSGMVKEPDTTFYQTFKSQATLLGRWCDVVQFRTLEELFRQDSVVALPPDESCRWPGLRWTGKLMAEGEDATIEVRLDPALGFALRSWQLGSATRGWIADRVENIRFIEVEGVHVPTLGVDITWNVRSTKEQWETIQARLLEAAEFLERSRPIPLAASTDQAAVTTFVRKEIAALHVRPGDGQAEVNVPAVGRKGAPLTPIVIETQIVSLNKGLSKQAEIAAAYQNRQVLDFKTQGKVKFADAYLALTKPASLGGTPVQRDTPK